MKIERKNSEESMIGQFPEWEGGKVVEIFQDGKSCGLFMMCNTHNYAQAMTLFSLEDGYPWSSSNGPFDGADYAIEVTGKFVEE